MKAWNKKHKPKHWTKPKWKIRSLNSSKTKFYFLKTRGIKNKYRFGDFFYHYMRNKPYIELLAKNKKVR